jgi:peptide/nickel transport system substrate-binding protein
MFKRVLTIGATLVLALAFLVQSPATLPTSAQENNGYTEADTADAVSFHPYQTTDTASSSYQGFVYAAGLTKRNPDTFKIEPLMAESWDISSDFLTYTFHLRKDMKWSDGQAITSADFKWTFDESNKPENEYPYRENFDFIKSYEAPDPYTLVITIKEKFCPALEGVDAVTPLPKHIWEKLDWKDPEKNPEIMHPTVFSGPFKLKEWAKDDHVIFEANDSYFLGRPKLDSYTIRIVPEQSIAYTMLKSGEVDSTGVLPEQYAEAKANPKLQMYEWWRAAGSWSYVGFNLRHDVLKDVRVRHALSYAFPRQPIIDKVLYGLARPLYSTIVPSSEYYNPDVPHYDYDQEKAKSLLKEAGYTQGSDGAWTKDGQPLKLKLIYGPNTSKTREKIAVVTQAEFKKLGIDVDVQGLEWGAFLKAQSSEPFDWDLTVNGWAATLEPYWMHQIWEEKFIPDLNYPAYVNKKVEDLFTQSASQCDNRKGIFNDIQRIIAEDSPYIFVSQDLSYVPINKRIGGVRATPLGIGWNVEQWYVVK